MMSLRRWALVATSILVMGWQSLALAADAVDEPVLLLESDLLFHPGLLRPLLTPGCIAVSRLQPWMHGTRVRVGASGALDAFEFGAIVVFCSQTRESIQVQLHGGFSQV